MGSKRILYTTCRHCLKEKGGLPLVQQKWYSDAVIEHNKGPLHGIRLLDLSRVLAGPYCSMIMGDLGAEIIKIEKPGSGDDTRTWGPPFCGTESAYYLSVNRNKKSVCVNIQHPEGQDIIRKLAMKSDVLLENYIPGKLSTMGLGYEQMSKIAPHLVYCSITGYGQTGPDAQRAGYDVIVAATGGLMDITGPEDGEPCKVGVAMTDLSTGLYAYGSIMAALLHCTKTGQGQHIDCSLLSTQVASLVNIASSYLNSGIEGKRLGTAHASIVPYQAFETLDGYIMAGAGNDKQFLVMCKHIGLAELAENPKYASNKERVVNRKALLELLKKRMFFFWKEPSDPPTKIIMLVCALPKFKSKKTTTWLQVLEGSGIPYGPINNLQQVFSDPQVLHNGMIQEMKHPTAGNIRVAGPAVKFSATPVVLNCPPPCLGQDTDEVLRRVLGIETQELEFLSKNGVIESQ